MKAIIGILFIAVTSSSIMALPADMDELPEYSRYDTIEKPVMRPPPIEMGEKPETELDQSLMSMSFEELIENASQNPGKIDAIAEILKSKFQIDKKRISITKRDSRMKYEIDGDVIYITNLQFAKKLIKDFCKFITKIDYDPEPFYDNISGIELFTLMNRVCTNLLDVNLPSNWGVYATEPFKSVKTAAVSNVVTKRLNLNEMYPNLEYLRMINLESSGAFVVDNYPNLKNLSYKFGDRADNLIEQVFRRNPQLTSFEPRDYLSMNFLRKVNTWLPNLETLYWYPYRQQFTQDMSSIKFKNVKYLYVRNWEEFGLPYFPFEYEKLERFTYYQYNSQPFNADWLKAISKSRNLKEIALPETKLTAQNLKEYSERFPNLKSVEFSFSTDVLNAATLQLLSNTKLETVSITHVPGTIPRNLNVNNSKWTYNFVNEMPANGMGTLRLMQKTM